MCLPIWLICVIIILLVAIFFVLFQGTYTERLTKWENEAQTILTGCGYSQISCPRIVKGDKTYTVGSHNNGQVVSATIYLYIESDTNTIRSALIHELAHIILPTISHSDREFHSVVEKLGLCYSQHSGYNPFLALDDKYPCQVE